jgi:activator of HSP90 ATPase
MCMCMEVWASSRGVLFSTAVAELVEGSSLKPSSWPLPFLPHCSMFGGSIQGIFRELIPHSRIVMDWRFSNWTDDVYSRVEVDIEEASKGDVRLKLRQSGIPSSDRYGNHDVQGTTLHGWRMQVFQRIRQVFGYGM